MKEVVVRCAWAEALLGTLVGDAGAEAKIDRRLGAGGQQGQEGHNLGRCRIHLCTPGPNALIVAGASQATVGPLGGPRASVHECTHWLRSKQAGSAPSWRKMVQRLRRRRRFISMMRSSAWGLGRKHPPRWAHAKPHRRRWTDGPHLVKPLGPLLAHRRENEVNTKGSELGRRHTPEDVSPGPKATRSRLARLVRYLSGRRDAQDLGQGIAHLVDVRQRPRCRPRAAPERCRGPPAVPVRRRYHPLLHTAAGAPPARMLPSRGKESCKMVNCETYACGRGGWATHAAKGAGGSDGLPGIP